MSCNFLEGLSEGKLGDFQWQNPSTIEALPQGGVGIRIKAPAKCDFFKDPAGMHMMASAPYLYLEVEGDFIAKAHVSHAFKTVWDSAAVMVWTDPDHWAKLCFESTDFGTRAIVSVVTNGVSDDANGVNYHWPDVWLQIVRAGNVFGMQYGPDGVHWNMVRYFGMDVPKKVRIGLVAQCPGGSGAELDFLAFHLEHETVGDLRAGV
jgi:hypothetical protein